MWENIFESMNAWIGRNDSLNKRQINWTRDRPTERQIDRQSEEKKKDTQKQLERKEPICFQDKPLFAGRLLEADEHRRANVSINEQKKKRYCTQHKHKIPWNEPILTQNKQILAQLHWTNLYSVTVNRSYLSYKDSTTVTMNRSLLSYN